MKKLLLKRITAVALLCAFVMSVMFAGGIREVEAAETKKLTLMVYMAADNDLESYALQNLKDMEHAGFSGMNILPKKVLKIFIFFLTTTKLETLVEISSLISFET